MGLENIGKAHSDLIRERYIIIYILKKERKNKVYIRNENETKVEQSSRSSELCIFIAMSVKTIKFESSTEMINVT